MIIAHCQPTLAIPSDTTSIYMLMFALFTSALVGSIAHCSSMCGPFVLAQVSGFAVPDKKDPKTWYRHLLIPYHLGRLTTYVGLGILVTYFMTPLFDFPELRLLAPILLAFAGVLFLASAVSQMTSFINFGLCSTPQWLMKKVASILPSHHLWSGYILGVLLGFLPCGLVYAAIIAVSATGNVEQAALGMLAFALGTMPMLLAIGVGGNLLLRSMTTHASLWVKPLLALLMTINSLVLFVIAIKGFV